MRFERATPAFELGRPCPRERGHCDWRHLRYRDIKTEHVVENRRNVKSRVGGKYNNHYAWKFRRINLPEMSLRFEVFTAVTMESCVFWDVQPRSSCKTHVSEELSASIIRVIRIGELCISS
jgi:hypothetical protein